MSDIIRVALSGGPCSGKTTCIEYIKAHYESKDIPVFVCNESATEVICDGVSREDMLLFETAVANNQIKLENELNNALANIDAEKILVIYDRGLTDCFGYVDDSKALEQNIGISRVESWSRYDAVMILESADCYESSDIRIEDEELAREYADSVLSAWLGHPHLRYIKAYDSFDDKISAIIGEIDCMVNDIEQEKKYLIEYPSLDDLSKYNPVCSHIEQVYLLSNVGSHRIRKRSVDGYDTYFETIKIRITDSMCTELEHIISKDDYISLLGNANPKKCPIIKDRYCFLYDGQYFELDLFPFWDDKAFMELELRDESQLITLPPEISVIKDVSDDKHYKNNYLATKLYKDTHNEDN